MSECRHGVAEDYCYVCLHARIEALERLHTDVRALIDSWGGIRETTLEDCVVADLAILAAEEKRP